MEEVKEFEDYKLQEDQVIEVDHNPVTVDDTVQDSINTDTIEELNDENAEIENINAEEEE